MSFSIIAAIDKKNGIGKGNQIPWHISDDFKYFARTTKATADPEKQNAVIMGTNTWLSLPENVRPLPNRLNVVLNLEASLQLPDGVLQFISLDEALIELNANEQIENMFIIGGGMLYTSSIDHPKCKKLYITKIKKEFDCDVFFPKISDKFKLVNQSEVFEEKGIKFEFLVYEKV